MKIVPLRDRILIKKDGIVEKTAGGIFIPDQSKEIPETGTVRAVGPGLTSVYGVLNPTVLKEGDRVIFPKFSGVDLKSLEDGLFMLPESEVLCKVEEE